MAWRVVKSLETLIAQEDQAHPGRSKASDGTIGDAAHQAQGTASDHNPRVVPVLGAEPVVLAADITHDPARGVDTFAQADALIASHDFRIDYVISNRRISGPFHNWQWQPYTGSDPHTSHMHVSVLPSYLADDTTPWRLTVTQPPEEQKVIDFVDPRVEAIANMLPGIIRGPLTGQPVALVHFLTELDAKVDQLATVVAQIKAALPAGGIALSGTVTASLTPVAAPPPAPPQ